MITQDRAQALKDGLAIFKDSKEVRDRLMSLSKSTDLPDLVRFELVEAAFHVAGLYEISKQLLKELQTAKEGNRG